MMTLVGESGQAGAMGVHHLDRVLAMAERLEAKMDPLRRPDDALVGRSIGSEPGLPRAIGVGGAFLVLAGPAGDEGGVSTVG